MSHRFWRFGSQLRRGAGALRQVGRVPGRIEYRPDLPPGEVIHLPGRGDVFLRRHSGPGHGVPVVLLHGVTWSADINFHGVIDALSKHSPVIAIDQRGHARGLPITDEFGGWNEKHYRPSSHDRPDILVEGPRSEEADVGSDGRCTAALAHPAGAATGTDEEEETAGVDVVGHSQGGTMPRYYTKFLGGAEKVANLVGLSPGNHGSTALGLAKLPGVPELLGLGLGPAMAQQVEGSPFINRLNEGGETVPGVRDTVIQTQWAEIATPYTTSFLTGPDVRNILMQDYCPLVGSDHLSIAFDSIAAHHVLNALDPEHATPPPCYPTPPFNGG